MYPDMLGVLLKHILAETILEAKKLAMCFFSSENLGYLVFLSAILKSGSILFRESEYTNAP